MTDSERKIAMAMMMIQAPQATPALAEMMSFQSVSASRKGVSVGGDEMKWLRAFPKRRPATAAWLALCFIASLTAELILLAGKLAGI